MKILENEKVKEAADELLKILASTVQVPLAFSKNGVANPELLISSIQMLYSKQMVIQRDMILQSAILDVMIRSMADEQLEAISTIVAAMLTKNSEILKKRIEEAASKIAVPKQSSIITPP